MCTVQNMNGVILPQEILLMTFECLSAADVARCCRVCKVWNTWIRKSPRIWSVVLLGNSSLSARVSDRVLLWHLIKAESLRLLDLEGCTLLSPDVPLPFERMVNLVGLNVSWTSISDSTLTKICTHCTQLKTVLAAGTRLDLARCFTSLFKLKDLKHLDISRTHASRDWTQDIRCEASAMNAGSSLQCLYMRGLNSGFEANTLIRMLNMLKHLVVLDISANSNIPNIDELLCALPWASPSLEVLDCRRCYGAKDSSLAHVATHCLCLRVLKTRQSVAHERLVLETFTDGWCYVIPRPAFTASIRDHDGQLCCGKFQHHCDSLRHKYVEM
eukprot:m.1191051 g.1191051  ORF g.1191051 m.1191051 type:complete len:329 (+) comp24556_c1_seq42:351-1337(+)